MGQKFINQLRIIIIDNLKLNTPEEKEAIRKHFKEKFEKDPKYKKAMLAGIVGGTGLYGLLKATDVM